MTWAAVRSCKMARILIAVCGVDGCHWYAMQHHQTGRQQQAEGRRRGTSRIVGSAVRASTDEAVAARTRLASSSRAAMFWRCAIVFNDQVLQQAAAEEQ